jgi:hypothetical protein
LGEGIWISVLSDTKSARIRDLIAFWDKIRSQTLQAQPTT